MGYKRLSEAKVSTYLSERATVIGRNEGWRVPNDINVAEFAIVAEVYSDPARRVHKQAVPDQGRPWSLSYVRRHCAFPRLPYVEVRTASNKRRA
jgi:hypothetical protein